jgi:TDG/mug DNA glycosylase family protein
MTIRTAFPPNVSSDARLLILGSLPGEESLRQGRYYAHPTNAFWWLIGEVIGEPLPSLPYEARLERLKARRIGLWDVIATARRQGSLDQAIRDAELRDLAGFVNGLPNLAAVAFNGATSARHGRRQLAGLERLTLLDLPSSSAAYAGMSREAKREQWLELRDFL